MSCQVTQTILYDPELEGERVYGNCLQAAVASLLDLPLDAVPHFSAFTWFHPAMELWARGRGLTVRIEDTVTSPQERCIVGGMSPRGVLHSCVAEGGVIVWDPHPSRAGLDSIVDATYFDEWTHDGPRCWLCKDEHSLGAEQKPTP